MSQSTFGDLENRMCSPEPPWLHPAYMERAWKASETLWTTESGDDEFIACVKRVREASRVALHELHSITRKWNLDMNPGGPPCNLDLGRAINYGEYSSRNIHLLNVSNAMRTVFF
jgi:hypothetical protein